MSLSKNINRLRTEAKLTQTEFAEKFGVTHQSVQKWESGETKPDLDNIIKISKFFSVSVDQLLFDSNQRIAEELPASRKLLPAYEKMHDWELYSNELALEYLQSTEEGLDLSEYRDLFHHVAKLKSGEYKSRFADILFEIVSNAAYQKDYNYVEPSDLQTIKKCRPPHSPSLPHVDPAKLTEKIEGAWYGRICGCLLGKPIEGIRTDELIPLLKETNNYPMTRYILSSDITAERIAKYRFPLANRCYADTINQAPADDDTNYTVLYQKVIDEFGKEFTPYELSQCWMNWQPKNAYCTAERVAFCNFVKGYLPPVSAVYKNPYREWIGAQIRADYFGYINPGNPEMASEMAWRDACISHVKNGIYGEMFVAAMIAAAAVSDDIFQIIESGLAQIPEKSRLYEAITTLLKNYKAGMKQKDCFKDIHARWDEHSGHAWCHTISNAEIVVAALLYGNNDFAKSICMAVETGFDTDCNGATVGSILGMKNGIRSIGQEWLAPLHGKLETAIFGVGTVRIDDLIEKTLKHIEL